MSLTPKQALFVAEYIKDFNATQAAIRAGYSERTAASQGQRVLHYVEIQNEIASALAGRIERIQVDSDWLLSRLVQEATADVADLFDGDGNLKPVSISESYLYRGYNKNDPAHTRALLSPVMSPRYRFPLTGYC